MALRFAIPCFAALRPDASAREKILTAASELLLTEGYSALTQTAVADRAGMRQSHVTYYFPTRNDLLRATAQYGVESLLDPITSVVKAARVTAADKSSAASEPTVAALRQLLMPDKTDRQWFRLLTGLMIASEQDELIRRWLGEFDERILEKLAAGFAAVGVPISVDELHFLHATFIGALYLDMQQQTELSFKRVERTVQRALDQVLPVVGTAAALKRAPAKAPLPLRKSAR